MREQHADKSAETELPILFDMCERLVCTDEKDNCSMCFKELTLIELRSHVAISLEDLALSVLPNTRNDEIEDPGLDFSEGAH